MFTLRRWNPSRFAPSICGRVLATGYVAAIPTDTTTVPVCVSINTWVRRVSDLTGPALDSLHEERREHDYERSSARCIAVRHRRAMSAVRGGLDGEDELGHGACHSLLGAWVMM